MYYEIVIIKKKKPCTNQIAQEITLPIVEAPYLPQ